MPNGFGMGVTPTAVGAALQAPPSDGYHQDPLPVRSDPPRTYEPREVDPQIEHSDTSTRLALAEALNRRAGARQGEYQQPKSPLALFQLQRAGLSPTEIAILTKSTATPVDVSAPPMAAQDATAVHLRKPDNILTTMDRYGVTDIVRNLSQHPTPAEAQAYLQRVGGGR